MVLFNAALSPNLTLFLSGFMNAILSYFIHTFGSMTCTRPIALIIHVPWNLVIFKYRLFCYIALFNACSLCFLMKITILLLWHLAMIQNEASKYQFPHCICILIMVASNISSLDEIHCTKMWIQSVIFRSKYNCKRRNIRNVNRQTGKKRLKKTVDNGRE